MPACKALLLRVGIDRGSGGSLAPIFADGSFEYVPIPETQPTRCPRPFARLCARRGGSLAAFVPPRVADRPAHVDPDFDACTYGDAATPKRRQLLRLDAGDLLVFYAGLAPAPPGGRPRLFAIGWFAVAELRSLTAQQIAAARRLPGRWTRTAHFQREPPDPALALVIGDPRQSRLLDRALPLGDGADRLLPDLAAFGYRGSLRRAVGHWLDGPGLAALETWLAEGPASLVDAPTRLFPVAVDRLREAPRGCHPGDLIVADPRPAIGDWVYSRDGAGRFALARINRRSDGGETGASLFWCIPGPAAVSRRIPVPDPDCHGEASAADIRRLVSWVASRYRIGVHPA